MGDEKMEISDAAKSGDGTIKNVGIKVGGKFKSPVNNQMFDTQEALDLHLKYLHDPKKVNPDIVEGRSAGGGQRCERPCPPRGPLRSASIRARCPGNARG